MAPTRRALSNGIGQLSLIEHALCPLDSRISLVHNFLHETTYAYTTPDNQRQTARVQVTCPWGLAAMDEVTLWGLLALTFRLPESAGELIATPHWCLRQLGIINPRSKRGGRQYRAFAESLRRLSSITYQNDAFYDPHRCEHRRISFHFFSYSLPTDPLSNRAWQITWDPVFYRMASATAGHLWFDLNLYRDLDPASRRLFLFVCKVLSRRPQLRALRLEQVAVDLIGFSPTLALRDMKAKVVRCLHKLVELQVLAEADVFRKAAGEYRVQLARGAYFAQRPQQHVSLTAPNSPLFASLVTLGFDEPTAARLIRHFPQRLLAEWIDITQAALERFGTSFFRKSPMAFLVNSVTHAAKGSRTAPDWWLDLKRTELRQQEVAPESRNLLKRIQRELGESSLVDYESSNDAPTRFGFSKPVDVLRDRPTRKPLSKSKSL